MCYGTTDAKRLEAIVAENNRREPAPDNCACLVYVRGTRGLEAQVWYPPMVTVTPDGKPKTTISPEGLVVVGDPILLPPREKPWRLDDAIAVAA